jgi:ADP-heptose:LPS heptosyltransferase
MNENKEHKVLVMRLSSLGDIVLLSPVFKNIKDKWPDARITLLVKEQFAQVLMGHPDIDDIIVYKKSQIYPPFGFTFNLKNNAFKFVFGHCQQKEI